MNVIDFRIVWQCQVYYCFLISFTQNEFLIREFTTFANMNIKIISQLFSGCFQEINVIFYISVHYRKHF